MKKSTGYVAFIAITLGLTTGAPAAVTDGMTLGKAELEQMNQLAFGPQGILFVADAKAGAVVAIATGDTKAVSSARSIKAEAINQKIASLLGTAVDQIAIRDLAVNPLSRQVYLAVSRGLGPDATPVLLRVKADGQPEIVSLDKVRFSRVELPNPVEDAPAAAPAAQGGGNRRNDRRMEAITDIAYADGRVVVAGLSNEEFASTLRTIAFPFKTADRGTAVEIYHGAHGKFETRSPVRTFVPYKIGNKSHLLAAYTCTPLVQFAMDELKPGTKITGKTIAEFGNRNRPLDLIVYKKDGKDYLLMANSARGVVKVAAEQISGAASITERVEGTKGLAFEKIAWEGVSQLDQLDARQAIVVRTVGDSTNLETLALP
jgi:hypothetical protein